MKKKLIGLIIGIFSFSIVSASSATELKLATFEPPKAFIASKILAAWATKVNQCSGTLNVKMYAGGVGFKRNPPIFMKPGDKVEVEVTQIGVLSNTIKDEII